MLDHATRCTQVFNELQRLFNQRAKMSINYVQLKKKLEDPNSYLVKQGPEDPDNPSEQEPSVDEVQKRVDELQMQRCQEMHDEAEQSIKALLDVTII